MGSKDSGSIRDDLIKTLKDRFGENAASTADRLEAPSEPKLKLKHAVPSQNFTTGVHFFSADAALGAFQLSRLAGLEAESGPLLFLDTETTGIGVGSLAFLIGFGRIADGGGFEVTRFLLEPGGDEEEFLKAAASFATSPSTLVTFNGLNFDMPLLKERFFRRSLPFSLGEKPHLDLLPPARRAWKKSAGSCRLVNLERHVLGFSREGDIPGAMIPAVYAAYAENPASPEMELVIRHNALDILGLACLMAELPKKEEKPKKPGGKKELKRRLAELKAEGDVEGALAFAKKLMDSSRDGDPFPFIEAARILEKELHNLAEALEVIERALKTPRIPGDREKLQKIAEKIESKLMRVK